MNDSNSDQAQSPWLSTDNQIKHLESKGVRFNLISKTDAKSYLLKNNNYFRIKSYCKGFPTINEGSHKSKFANLDFKMLIDLSIIDMMLRNTMLKMTLDIEHFSKIELLEYIESKNEDGYKIVREFIASYDVSENEVISNRLKRELDLRSKDPYIGSLISKYPDHNYPIWVFLEVIPFGTYIYFVKFCAKYFNEKGFRDDFYLLQNVKSLRNACAHNNCIINDLSPNTAAYSPNRLLTQAVARIPTIGASQRKKRLSNERLKHIATTLLLHYQKVSDGVKEHTKDDLNKLVERMFKHIDYYSGNGQITSSFNLIKKLIDHWY